MGVTPNVVIPAGTHTVTLIVNDGILDSDPDTAQITVQDATAPSIDLTCPPEKTDPFAMLGFGSINGAGHKGTNGYNIRLRLMFPWSGFLFDFPTTTFYSKTKTHFLTLNSLNCQIKTHIK